MRTAIALIIALFTATAAAQEITAVDVSDLADGRYVLTVEGGNVAIVPLNLIRLGDNPTTPAPKPTPSTGLAGIVQAEIAKLPADQKAKASEVAAVYLIVAAQIKMGSITPAQASAETKAGVESVTGDGFEDWRDFGTAVNKWMADNRVSSSADIIAAYQTVASSITSNSAINWLSLIIKVLPIILEGEFNWAKLLPIILEILQGLN